MPPNNLEQKINNMEQLLRQHQHNGADFTEQLRGQDLQQLGKIILAAAAASISLTIPVKQYLKIIISWGAKSGASNDYLRFNSDSAANYTTTTGVSQSQIDLRNGANSALGGFSIIEIFNVSSLVKPVFIHTINRITAAGTAISSYALFASWVNTSDLITTIGVISSNAQTYPSDSSILILSSKE